MHIQFLAQSHCRTETSNETVDGQILGDLIFAINVLQYQCPLWLIQLLNKFLMATFVLSFELRRGQLFIEVIIQCF